MASCLSEVQGSTDINVQSVRKCVKLVVTCIAWVVMHIL